MPSKLGHYIFLLCVYAKTSSFYRGWKPLSIFFFLSLRVLFFLVIASVSEAISFIIGLSGIALPAFGGLAMTEGVRRACNDF